MDTFIELYKQDRKRFLAIPLAEKSHSNDPALPPWPPKAGAPVTSGSCGSLGMSQSDNNRKPMVSNTGQISALPTETNINRQVVLGTQLPNHQDLRSTTAAATDHQSKAIQAARPRTRPQFVITTTAPSTVAPAGIQ